MDVTITPSELSGSINAIASKSEAHRVLLCAAFADVVTDIDCNTTSEDVDATIEWLAPMTLAERESIVGLDPRRAPVILAGVLVLQEVMEAGGFRAYTASESDILQGIVLDQARA